MSMIMSRPRIHWSDLYDGCVTRVGTVSAVRDFRLAGRVRSRPGRDVRRAFAHARAGRQGRFLLLPPGRASRDRALDGAVTEPVSVGGGAAYAARPPGSAELHLAHLRPDSTARRDLHARPAERRPTRAGVEPRLHGRAHRR